MASPFTEVEVDDRVVKVTNPDRVYFPGVAARPSSTWSSTTSRSATASSTRCSSARACCTGSPRGWPATRCTRSGCPPGAPPWVETVRLHFPRWNRTADELCVTELGAVIWAVQMSTVEFHPWNSRRADTEKPDEWRIDLDPGPLSDFAQVQRVAGVVHEVLDELGAVGYPKTSGGKGLHVYVRIPPDHGFKRRTPGGARVRPRGRAAGPRRRHDRRGGARTATRTTCSSTTTRTPATTPSPRRTRSAASPTPGSRRRSAGTRSTTATRATSRSSPCRSGTPSSATCTRASTATSSTSRRCWSGPTATTPRARAAADRRRTTRPRILAVALRMNADHAEHPERRLRRARGRGGADPQRRLGARRRDGQPLRPQPDVRADDGRGARAGDRRPARRPPDDRGRPTARRWRTSRRAPARSPSTSRPRRRRCGWPASCAPTVPGPAWRCKPATPDRALRGPARPSSTWCC